MLPYTRNNMRPGYHTGQRHHLTLRWGMHGSRVMTQQVVGLFDTRRDAEMTVHDLQRAGINNADISFVGSNARGEYDDTQRNIAGATNAGESEASEGAGVGATGGAIAGGITGVLVGLGALAIQGIVPILAAGPFAAAIGTTGAAFGAGAVGAAAGAAAGGLLGALVGAGIPEEDANVYAEGIRRGGTLVMARVEDAQVDDAINVMDRNNVVDIDQRSQEYRSGGWNRYDENAEPYDFSTAGRGMVAERQVGGTRMSSTPTRRARPYAYTDATDVGTTRRPR